MGIFTRKEEIHPRRSSSYEYLPPDFALRRVLLDQQESQTQTDMNIKDDQEDVESRRIVLLGKTGSGKSSLVNTIFGERVFECDVKPRSVSNSCQTAEVKVGGSNITAVDIPGLFDTPCRFDTELDSALRIAELAPGPHVFLLVLKVETYSHAENEILQRFLNFFSEEPLKYTMVVITHGVELEPKNLRIEELIRQNNDLKNLISRCGGRSHVFDNNRERKDRSQVTELMKKIDDIVRENGGGYYTNDTFEEKETGKKYRGDGERAGQNDARKWNDVQFRYEREKSKNTRKKEELPMSKESIKRYIKGLIQVHQQFEKKKKNQK